MSCSVPNMIGFGPPSQSKPNKAHILATGQYGETILHLLAQRGNTALIRTLLQIFSPAKRSTLTAFHRNKQARHRGPGGARGTHRQAHHVQGRQTDAVHRPPLPAAQPHRALKAWADVHARLRVLRPQRARYAPSVLRRGGGVLFRFHRGLHRVARAPRRRGRRPRARACRHLNPPLPCTFCAQGFGNFSHRMAASVGAFLLHAERLRLVCQVGAFARVR